MFQTVKFNDDFKLQKGSHYYRGC